MNEFVVTCPDCGEEVTTHVEEDVRGSFVQDCEVCCNPWLVRLTRSRVGGRRSPRRHVADPGMIELMVKHGGWIDAASVGYLREVEIARRMLAGELDPHLEFGTFSGQTVAEQILWSGASFG